MQFASHEHVQQGKLGLGRIPTIRTRCVIMPTAAAACSEVSTMCQPRHTAHPVCMVSVWTFPTHCSHSLTIQQTETRPELFTDHMDA